MVSYPGHIEMHPHQRRGEAYIEVTITDARGRVGALVLAIDPGKLLLALTGKAPQPCTITSATYPLPHGVVDRPEDREVSCE